MSAGANWKEDEDPSPDGFFSNPFEVSVSPALGRPQPRLNLNGELMQPGAGAPEWKGKPRSKGVG